MRMTTIDFSALMTAVDIDAKGEITVSDDMSGLEANPKDDWLYLALRAMKRLAVEKKSIRSMAIIGCGNGIDAIAALNIFPEIENLYITDIIPEILPDIRKNIEKNVPSDVLERKKITYLAGRDCDPLSEKVDFIYGNLPLVMVDSSKLEKNLATTTLTDARPYAYLAESEEDVLKKYSLLSQLGFLRSAKEKLLPGGSLVTLIGGRVPTSAIAECFRRAGLAYERTDIVFMMQSDAQFLEQYAIYEKENGIEFSFYKYEQATALLKERTGIDVPGTVDGYDEPTIREIIRSAEINAEEAYSLVNEDKRVGHLAYAFLARPL